MEELHNKDVDSLFDAIMSLKSKEECYAFFEDALTVKEILDISQRLKAAKMLKKGKSYNEVCRVTGMSSATICRVSKAMERGRGGYKMILERVGVDDDDQ